MRVLFVSRSMAHFTYYDTILKALCSRGHEVELLFDPTWSRGSKEVIADVQAAFPTLRVGIAEQRRDTWRPWIFPARELRSYHSYLVRPGQSSYYLERWESYLPKALLSRTSKRLRRGLFRQPVVGAGLSLFERMVPAAPNVVASILHCRPDVVVATPIDMRFDEEVEYVKAASALGIPTAVPVLSWDNLTTKGLFHALPSLTLAWNEVQRQEAINIHGVPPSRAVVTGSPFFDKWFDCQRFRRDRVDFCARVGLDVGAPYFVYLGSSANIARDETWLVRQISSGMAGHPRLHQARLLVRPHPANAGIYEALEQEDSRVRVWPREGALPASEEMKADFYNTLLHSKGTIGINTSGMIDAVILDKPCVTVVSKKYAKTQEESAHFRHLLDADVLEVGRDVDSCLQRLDLLLGGGDIRASQRASFVESFVRPRGRTTSAGEVAARAIEELAAGTPVALIDDRLCMERVR